jgi:Spy/CpxP family protein refolding chaperone
MSNRNARRFPLLGVLCASLLLYGNASAQGLLAQRLVERAAARHDALVQNLDLNASQRAALAQVEATRNTFLLQLLADLPPLMARVKADLANPAADLRATAAIVQATVDRELLAHRQVVEARLDFFYEVLTPAQQAIVRAELTERLAALEKLREALLALAATR